MPITKQNVLRHELIGLEVRINNSSDPTLVGVRGRIADETRDMLVIEQSGKPKKILKATSILTLTLPSGDEVEVDGLKLVGKPEERVKR